MKFKIQKAIAVLLFTIDVFLLGVLYAICDLEIQNCDFKNEIVILEIMGQDFIYTFENEV